MWFEKKKFEAIGAAVHEKKKDSLDHLLTEIVQSHETDSNIPTRCPQCGKDLIRQVLSYLELFVSACPEKHGFWMNHEVSKKLREFISEQISIVRDKKHTVKILNAVLYVIVAVYMFAYLPGFFKNVESHYAQARIQKLNETIDENFWPMRDPTAFPALPLKESVIDFQDELSYFQDWMDVMYEGASNRMNMAGVLETKRTPEQYQKIFDVYSIRQSEIIRRLHELSVPARLKDFHEHIVRAYEAQIRFYAHFVEAKFENPTLALAQMLKDPDLTEESRSLHFAYGEILKIYPDIDRQTHDAIERRLCWSDII